MKRLFGLAGACLLALAASGCDAAEPQAESRPDVAEVERSDPAMNAAIAEARRTLPQFLAALANPPAGTSDYGFKYPLAGREHIWVDHVARQGGTLTGRLANVPMEKGFRQGQAVTVPLSAVSDWAYRGADGVVRGHRTTRVLLPRLDPAQAQAAREALGWTE